MAKEWRCSSCAQWRSFVLDIKNLCSKEAGGWGNSASDVIPQPCDPQMPPPPRTLVYSRSRSWLALCTSLCSSLSALPNLWGSVGRRWFALLYTLETASRASAEMLCLAVRALNPFLPLLQCHDFISKTLEETVYNFWDFWTICSSTWSSAHSGDFTIS